MKISENWRHRLLRSVPARMVLFILFAALLGVATSILFDALGWSAKGAPPAQRLAANLIGQIGAIVGAYVLLARVVEKRRMTELAPGRILPTGLAGVAGGTLLSFAVIGTLWGVGAYRVVGTNDQVPWAFDLLVIGLATAIAEETIFRGVLFRLLEESLGFKWALAISAVFFGGVHIANPGATFWTSFAIAVEAGVLLGVVFHVTRSLPACIGVHMAWNFLEGTVFGSPVSGVARSGWLQPQFSGPEWLTGGSFGIEASVLTVAFSLAGSLALLAARRRRAPDNVPMAAGA